METKLFIILIGFFIVSCSSSKEITTELQEVEPEVESLVLEEIAPSEKPLDQINKELLTNKINKIIQNYLGVPISSIARSDIEETIDGYQWKFMNVKTGENFIANSDLNFETVQITKNKRS